MSEYTSQLDELQRAGRLRSFRPLENRRGCHVDYNNATMLNLTSNDYLGLAGDLPLHEAFFSNMEQLGLEGYGLGSASSRLLTGDSPMAHQLEENIRVAYDRQSCLLFNSGYHANIGILPSLTTKRDLILSDKLNHASIHDGMRLCRAPYKRYRHLDYEHLSTLIKSNRDNVDNIYIVSESVFSMDGDEANLQELVQIKNEFGCILYIDEAHGVGLYGESGLGKAEEYGVIDEIDLLMGTFGKAYASVGAYLLCDSDIYDFLVNRSRSLIFTTALPPITIHWNNFIFKHSLTLTRERSNLELLAQRLRENLKAAGLETRGSTNIVPLIIGNDKKTVNLATLMQQRGYLIFGVRPPTVPEGTSRFRLSLTANMKWSQLRDIPDLISEALGNI